MKFYAKVVRGNLITIPKAIRQNEDIKVGDVLIVEVVKKDSVTQQKNSLESIYTDKGGK